MYIFQLKLPVSGFSRKKQTCQLSLFVGQNCWQLPAAFNLTPLISIDWRQNKPAGKRVCWYLGKGKGKSVPLQAWSGPQSVPET